MIPLYDRNRRRHVPIVTLTLIAINVLVFLYELQVLATGGEKALTQLIQRFGLKPGCFAALVSFETCVVPLLTSVFLHAGWLHLLGNMWFLWVFGDNIEDRLGHGRFLIFYLLGGVAASCAHIVMTMLFTGDAFIPTIGASGCVSAVLGAYWVTFPTARIVTFVPIFIFGYLFEIPASIYLLVWFVIGQVLPGLGGLGAPGTGGVAFWAHIGGFVAGALYLGLYNSIHRSGAARGPGRHVRYRAV